MEDKMDKKINEENLDKVSGGNAIDDAIADVHIKGTQGGNGLGIKGNPLGDMCRLTIEPMRDAFNNTRNPRPT